MKRIALTALVSQRPARVQRTGVAEGFIDVILAGP